METKTISQKENKIVLENRKKAIISGIEKVDNVNTNQISMQTNASTFFVLGSNLHIDKLDVESGHLEISGQIDGIKYTDKKQNFFKRMFK